VWEKGCAGRQDLLDLSGKFCVRSVGVQNELDDYGEKIIKKRGFVVGKRWWKIVRK
jgi:hypothetical protein